MSDTLPKSVHDRPKITPSIREIETGEKASLTVGFDKDALRALDAESVFDEGVWDREEKIERLKDTLELYARLPDQLHFESGLTAIFGDNGAGKTLLADVIIMAAHMEVYRQKNSLAFEEDILPRYKGEAGKFYPLLPGRLHSGPEGYGEDDHTNFVARIATCMRVHDAALYSIDKYDLANAHRSPAALGNVAVGMSSRQAVDYLKNSRRRSSHNSIVMHDEPELGMSPRRQLTLLAELTDKPSGAVELVPTNSIILFESADVSRIDLDDPEKGVYKP